MATNIITSKTRAYRDVKPPVGSQLDFSHPLSKGLVGAWLMNEGGGNLVNEIAGKKNGVATAPVWQSSLKDRVIKFNGSSSKVVSSASGVNTLYPMSFFCYVMLDTAQLGRVFHLKSNGNMGFQITYDTTNNGWVCVVGADGVETNWGSSFHSYCASGTNVVGRWYRLHGILTPNTIGSASGYLQPEFYVDGVRATTGAGTWGSGSDLGQIWFGARNDGASFFNGKIAQFYLWNRALSPSEIKSLYEAPYQMVAPARKIRYITPGVGGVTPPATQDATVTPNAIVSRFFAPAVSVTATSASQSATITATAIKASFVAPAITAEATKNATVTATAIQVSVVAPSVSVSTGGNASISVSAIKASFVANPVTVEATKNAVAVATAAAVRFLANSVTISTTTSAVVSVTSVSVKFVSGVATVQAIRNVTIDATSAYAQFLVNSATIVIGGVDSGITEVILLSSLVSKRLHEKSRISKRLNEASRIDKTLLLDSPIH